MLALCTYYVKHVCMTDILRIFLERKVASPTLTSSRIATLWFVTTSGRSGARLCTRELQRKKLREKPSRRREPECHLVHLHARYFLSPQPKYPSVGTWIVASCKHCVVLERYTLCHSTRINAASQSFAKNTCYIELSPYNSCHARTSFTQVSTSSLHSYERGKSHKKN